MKGGVTIKTTTAIRLKTIMNERNIKQVDILELCKPFCIKYNTKLAKNDLSQYVSGKVQPGQDKLTILGLALGVNEVWLMGYDVPNECNYLKQYNPLQNSKKEIINERILTLINKFENLDDIDKIRIEERIDMLLEDEKYLSKKELKNA